jgi:hypothetical protein
LARLCQLEKKASTNYKDLILKKKIKKKNMDKRLTRIFLSTKLYIILPRTDMELPVLFFIILFFVFFASFEEQTNKSRYE